MRQSGVKLTRENTLSDTLSLVPGKSLESKSQSHRQMHLCMLMTQVSPPPLQQLVSSPSTLSSIDCSGLEDKTLQIKASLENVLPPPSVRVCNQLKIHSSGLVFLNAWVSRRVCYTCVLYIGDEVHQYIVPYVHLQHHS